MRLIVTYCNVKFTFQQLFLAQTDVAGNCQVEYQRSSDSVLTKIKTSCSPADAIERVTNSNEVCC